jgi:2-iminoacetate synthase
VAGFSEVFQKMQAQLEALTEPRTPSRSIRSIVEASAQRGLDTGDVATLIAWGSDPHCREEIRAGAVKVRERAASREIEFIIPIYLTSFCQNDCLYCGYRKGNPLAERIRLSLDDFSCELDVILGWGHRQIELVLSDDPELGSSQLLPYIELTRKKLDGAGGGVVALCAPVYEQEEYRRLGESGLDWVVEWQETYHQPHFDRWHFLDSPKRHYEERLDLWDHTIAAGLRRVGMGVLLGLYDWRFDVLALLEHADYVRRVYGLEPHAVGIPRLKPARGVLASQKPSRFTVSDEDYRFIVSLYHLAFPCSRLFFNTREAYDFNLSMVAGGDLFTVDCETLPGAYLRGHLPGQFSTHNYPPRGEVVRALGQRGFSARYLEREVEARAGACAMAAGVDKEQRAPAEFDFEEWTRGYVQVCRRLDDFEARLSELSTAADARRQATAEEWRTFLKAFEAVAIEPCRKVEPVLATCTDESRRSELLAYHERFGIDLDKFDRQISSYELSGDPTVLLMIGKRILWELREHLAMERELLSES